MKSRPRTSREVLELVRRYVDQHQPKNFRLVVPDDAVMHITEGEDEGGDRWYVVVRYEPDRMELLRKYSDLAIQIEEKIQKKEKLNVYLSTMLPHY